MTIQQFIIKVDSEPTDDQVDAIFQWDDQPGVEGSPRERTGEVHFLRDAPNLLDAILTAVRDLEAIGLWPIGIEDDDYATLGDIARRIGRTREAVRLWTVGKVGPGGFPPPLTDADSRTTFYSWIQVAAWLNERMGYDIPQPDPTLHAANLMLQIRALKPLVPRLDELGGLLVAA